MTIIDRSGFRAEVARQFCVHPVVGLLGARQVGKTTLARLIADDEGGPVHWFDLEDPAALARLADPRLALAPLEGLVVLDEIQRLPDVFAVLRGLVDRPDSETRFLVLGSAAPELLRQSAETLAGRIGYVELSGLHLGEVGAEAVERLWLRGGFPRAFQADSDDDSFTWREAFVRTFLERDLALLGIGFPSQTMGRLWRMLAHSQGQVLNLSQLARSFGVADTTVRGWVDALVGTLMVRRLQPWHANVGKRQVKRPKTYLTDTGLLHALLGLPTEEDVLSHPICGASWETFALEQVVHATGARPEECHFWATYAGAELDLLVERGRRRLGFEMKRTSAPRVTRSMRIALEDLQLDRLDVIHAGDETFPLAERVRAVSIRRVFDDVGAIGGEVGRGD